MIFRTIRLIPIIIFVLLGLNLNAQVSKITTKNYKVEKYEAFIKSNTSKVPEEFDKGFCKLEISITYNKNIVITNEIGGVLNSYTILEEKPFTPNAVSTTYECSGLDNRLHKITFTKGSATENVDVKLFVSSNILLHTVLYIFYLKPI